MNGEIVADAEGQEFLAGSVARQVLPRACRSPVPSQCGPATAAFSPPCCPRACARSPSHRRGRGPQRPGASRRPVDLILTYSISGRRLDAAGRAVLSNLRVLAFDQRLGPEAPRRGQGGQGRGARRSPGPRRSRSPRARPEIITLAQTLGSLSLVLNSVRDGGGEKDKEDRGGEPRRPLPSFLKAAEATGGRRQTLESDVTSTNKVQIVRRADPRHRRPARRRRRPRRPPPPNKPARREQSSETTSPLAVALAAALVTTLPANWPIALGAFELVQPQGAESVSLVVGTGQLIRVEEAFSSLFVANPEVADVEVIAAAHISPASAWARRRSSRSTRTTTC